jgi:hypothetical protein
MNEIRELTETEIEAVSGGGGGPLVNLPITIQNNFAVPTAVAIGVGGPASAGNLIGGLTNFGFQL